MVVGIEGGVSGNIQLSPFAAQVQLDENIINESDTNYTIYVDDELIVEDGQQSSLQFYNHSIFTKDADSQTITIDVAGTTQNGKAFERTFIKNSK
ncbi:hypothetical protein [Alkalicoccobacillus porphyridii]|uniref:Uncharacterized protein n=1 Tax=Alkalicoccobacillus porphyridii TaxID=2597270 RepID=A0A553ZUG3_9BACI|nr:hypothetical protein [Alkalicoccobacillus porphyridii]TSB44946.1 hypothetical protein FN960_19060 [Alkalicoccobacillus porphyridii]